MRRNLWKKVTSATLCAAMVGGIMVSNGALAVQAEEGEEKEVITLRVMGETGMDGISTDDAVGRYIKEKLGIVLEYTNVSTDRLKVMASGGDLPDLVERKTSGCIRVFKRYYWRRKYLFYSDKCSDRE